MSLIRRRRKCSCTHRPCLLKWTLYFLHQTKIVRLDHVDCRWVRWFALGDAVMILRIASCTFAEKEKFRITRLLERRLNKIIIPDGFVINRRMGACLYNVAVDVNVISVKHVLFLFILIYALCRTWKCRSMLFVKFDKGRKTDTLINEWNNKWVFVLFKLQTLKHSSTLFRNGSWITCLTHES